MSHWISYAYVYTCARAGFDVHGQAPTVAPNQELHGGAFFTAVERCTSQVPGIYTDG